MVTNTKEHMREYQAKRRAELKSKESVKNVKKVVKNNKMLNIALERLRPPREVEKEIEQVRDLKQTNESQRYELSDSKTSEMDDAFLWLANNSSFRMLLMEWVKKVIPGYENIKTRGKQHIIKKSFDTTRARMGGVINEFKEKVERMRKK